MIRTFFRIFVVSKEKSHTGHCHTVCVCVKVPVISWFDDMSDRELLNLIPFFEALASIDDVYTFLGTTAEQLTDHDNTTNYYHLVNTTTALNSTAYHTDSTTLNTTVYHNTNTTVYHTDSMAYQTDGMAFQTDGTAFQTDGTTYHMSTIASPAPVISDNIGDGDNEVDDDDDDVSMSKNTVEQEE